MTYVLCHGFGFTNDYWDPFIPYLDDKYIFFDEKFKLDSCETYIGIGHSLGFLKLNLSGIRMKALVGLQGFLNFCGNTSPQREILKKNLARIIHSFSQNPKNTLKFFYKLCGYPQQNIPKKISKEGLIADLELMKQSFSPCTAPILIIGSLQDNVVSKSILEDNFKPPIVLQFIDGVNHTLGFAKPRETFEIVQHFLKTLK